MKRFFAFALFVTCSLVADVSHAQFPSNLFQGSGSFRNVPVGQIVRETVQQSFQPGRIVQTPQYRTYPVQPGVIYPSQPVYPSQPSCGNTCPPVYVSPGHPVTPGPVTTHPGNGTVITTRPVATGPVTSPQPAPTPIQVARSETNKAKTAFSVGNYSQSTKHLNQVLKLVPDNTDAYQFRSLSLFSEGNYEAAAADAYDALSKGANTWNLEVVHSLYPSPSTYSMRLKQLQVAMEKQEAMPLHFLMAYHCLVQGDLQNGQNHLQAVLALQPEEPLSMKLLAAVQSRLAETTETQSGDSPTLAGQQ